MFDPERKKACVVASILFLTLAPMAIGCGKRGSPVSSINPEYSRDAARKRSDSYESEKFRNTRSHQGRFLNELNFEYQIILLEELAEEIHSIDAPFTHHEASRKERLGEVASEAAEKLREKNPNAKEIINNLESRLLKKVDGCDSATGAPDRNDVIASCERQAPVYEKTIEAIRAIACGRVVEIIISAPSEPVSMSAAGESASLSATAYFAEPSCEGVIVTKRARWASSDASVADFAAGPGVLMANGDGAAFITADAFGIDASNEISVNVSLCDEIIFEDPGVDAAVRQAAGYSGPADGPICAEYVAAIKQLYLGGMMTTGSLLGIEGLANLRLLYAQNNGITDITPLTALKRLTNLLLDDNQITDLSPLSSLSNLAYFRIARNEISDLSPLSKISRLVVVWLNGNNIFDISPLASHAGITQLRLDFNSISDLSAIASMRNLVDLRVTDNLISDLSPLAGISSLKSVALNNNNVSDLAPLAGSQLITLAISNNPVGSLSALAEMTSLTNLAAENSNVSDISHLTSLPNLESVVLSYNAITSVSSLRNALKISYLGLRNNKISNIADLVQSQGVGEGDILILRGNPLDRESIDIHIPELASRGATVYR